jgi:23S rRNA (uracil1939-C5)-methyltransferase
MNVLDHGASFRALPPARAGRFPAPAGTGDIVELEVTDLDSKGRGVGRFQGVVVFVDGGLPADRIRARIVRGRASGKGHYVADLVAVVRPSPDRVGPPCPVAAACGGCQLMALSYPAQLRWKTRRVREALRRIGHLEAVPVADCLGASRQLGYRNKAQFPVSAVRGKGLVAGLYRRGTHAVVPVESCLLQRPPGDRVVAAAVDVARESGLEAYDEKSGRGLLRHILVRVSSDGREAMAVFVTARGTFPAGKRLAAALRKRVPEVRTVVQNVNARRTNVILGPRNIVLSGPGYIHDTLAGLRFRVSVSSFFQVNPEQAEALYGVVADMAEGARRVVDVYSGVGTVALYLARKVSGLEEVTGIESNPNAVRDAAANARSNGVEKAVFICGDAARVLREMSRAGVRPDTVILDPPRKGCEKAVLETLADMDCRRVVYISCNPATLARDLAVLAARGYRTERVQPVDMFPQTTHVESCSLVVRR